MRVFISESARKEFYRLMPGIQARLKKGFVRLEEDPYEKRSGADIKKLKVSKDPELYRLRVGDYRAVYTIDGDEVRITSIKHRKKGYSWLE